MAYSQAIDIFRHKKNPPPRSTGAAGFVVSALDQTVSTFNE
jgi:hypothetical protein